LLKNIRSFGSRKPLSPQITGGKKQSDEEQKSAACPPVFFC
jgi:hypothetical protein